MELLLYTVQALHCAMSPLTMVVLTVLLVLS